MAQPNLCFGVFADIMANGYLLSRRVAVILVSLLHAVPSATVRLYERAFRKCVEEEY